MDYSDQAVGLGLDDVQSSAVMTRSPSCYVMKYLGILAISTVGARSGEPLPAFSRLPADSVLFEVGVHSAANGRIKVCGTEAFE